MDNIKYRDIEVQLMEFERYIVNKYIEVDRFNVYMDEGGYIYLSDLYIKAENRGEGIGSRILGELGLFADKAGVEVYCIPSSDDDSEYGDERLINFYIGNGYEVVREHGQGVVRMCRRCNKSE
jgi:GNAT superfamily N-acetyltransferase